MRARLQSFLATGIMTLLSVERGMAFLPYGQQKRECRLARSIVPQTPWTATTRSQWSSLSLASRSTSYVEDAIETKASSITVLPRFKAALVKAGMIAFIASLCVLLPLTLFPQKLLLKLGLVSKVQSENMALATGNFCCRWMLRLIPFCHVKISGGGDEVNNDPQPCIWVCNHTSMLDVFLLMAKDRQLRGRHKRPLKIIYWRQLESNPVTKIMFRQAGFIPVNMAANKPGEDNVYDKNSFKQLLKDTKQAFAEGFDIGILPEGQLNPTPEKGLLPLFAGAYTLAKMSRRPMNMMAIHGVHRLWHPDDSIGMNVTGRRVKIRCYPIGRTFESAEEFKTTFGKLVGTFGTTGHDLPEPELKSWMTGIAWAEKKGTELQL